MGTVTSTIGLISGINYGQLVDELVQASSGEVNNQTTQNTAFSNQQSAVTTLEASLVALQNSTNALSSSSLYSQRTTTSSNTSVLNATVSGQAQTGQYQITAAQLAQTQQFQSSRFASDTNPIGAGTLTIGSGGLVDAGASLDLLNDGDGISRGQITLTDRSGASATVDLRFATNIDDVLNAINSAGIGIQASVVGDQIKLVDTTGQTASNLKVAEVGGGTTAASLGLSGINVAANQATGSDVLQLFGDLSLNLLNDGNGVNFNKFLPDLQVNFRDGTSTTVDFDPVNSSTQQQTLNDVVNTLNNAAPGKLQASIDPSGHLVLTDLTTDDGSTFAVSAINGSEAAQDLGLTATASGDTISGNRILGGLKSVLLSSLNGGAGLGTLGTIDITDRSGNSATVDLSSAQTLDDVVQAINGAGIGVQAQINDARNGIEVVDTTGHTTHNLTIANGDATNSADKLGLTVDAATNSQSGGSLDLQTVSESTLLSSLNGGGGVGAGSFKITGSSGLSATLNVGSNIQTVGDLIQAINVLNVGVTAQINSAGDGIVLVDTAHGPSTLKVTASSGSTASDLHLLAGAQTVSVGGVPTQEINGSSTLTINLSSTTTLQDLANQINSSGFGVQASISNDGSSVKPFHLTLTNAVSGKAAALSIDTSNVGFSLQETVAAQDAVAVLGSPNSPSSIVATSSTNTFTNLVTGLSVALSDTSPNPVTVTVGSTNTSLESALQAVVSSYNTVQSQIAQDTGFNTTSNTGGVLQGDPTVNEVSTFLGNLIAGDIPGASSIQSLAQLGIIVQQDGSLSFDTSVFEAQYSKDPQAVQGFLSTTNTGVSDRFKTLINSLAGADNSLLAERATTLGNKLSNGQQRLDSLNQQLANLRAQLTTEFQNSELAIAKIQSDLAAINAIQPFSFANTSSSTNNNTAKTASTSSITG